MGGIYLLIICIKEFVIFFLYFWFVFYKYYLILVWLVYLDFFYIEHIIVVNYMNELTNFILKITLLQHGMQRKTENYPWRYR